MTKRDFEALAGALRDTGELWARKVAEEHGTVEPADARELARVVRAHELYVSSVANVLRETNQRFDGDRFKDAAHVRGLCGIRTGVGLCLQPCTAGERTCKGHGGK